jgi:hypothetical protein
MGWEGIFRRIFFENLGGEYLGESFLVLSSMGEDVI